jgi:hypothetical protein
MLSRIDEANLVLLPNEDLRFALLEVNPHSGSLRHDSEFRWTVSAWSELKFPVLQRGQMSCLAEDAMMKNELRLMIDRLICSINLWNQKEKELWRTNKNNFLTYHWNSYYFFNTQNYIVGIHSQHK